MKTVLFRNHTQRTLCIDSWILLRKFGAAFVAAAIEHIAASFGSHALKKSVLASAVTFFWLKCSLWHKY
jgi:hypothetical protein